MYAVMFAPGDVIS